MRQYDREETNPIIIEENLRLAKGTRRTVAQPLPALVSGDWMVSPDGVEGYIAGRSLDDPDMWIFVIKTGESAWARATVEMRTDAFVGFKLKENVREKSPLDDDNV
jgi:hypothetical protein